MEAIWNEVKNAIKKQIPIHSFRMWIEPMEFIECKECSITLACPNNFSKRKILDHYAELITSEINRETKKAYKLSIEITKGNGNSKKKSDVHPQIPLPNVNVHPHGGRLLRRDFTFDQFVVGGNNDFAYSAALSIASQKKSQQNSLFLIAKTGMGKSHLSQAVGHHILSESPSDRVYYITSEDFTNEMIHAIRHNSTDKFKERYRKKCDVLLLEDVHFLSGKERTQIELALTLDTLLDADKKIIFSSCYLPGDIPKLNDKLRSHLTCGIISNIDPPNFRTRVKILQKKTMINGYSFPEEVTHYLAGELKENVRQLNSGLIGVAAKSALLGAPINLDLAESVVKNIVRQSNQITIDTIKKLVCKHYRLTVKDIVSNSRKQSIVRPRQIAIYLARRYTDQSLQIIGKSFNRYHATALYAINVVERGLKENGPLQQQVVYLRRKLESG
ncbi:MAG: chromosomal replication initiator protein DnaA [Deltaproteobacteria bacterium]|nr:chromosomal replication initiator protein DnaA [Deltaproteobacteria bacterium]MBW2199241.1 chromosomal replication initiator protein DnaA [Deltaproteobacteria bacterium]MBW2538411.1 chromosomal replication initiator protein DnaA [Deltaproteobacteria bacterium]